MRMSRKASKQRVVDLLDQLHRIKSEQVAAGMKDVSVDEEYVMQWRLFGPDRPSLVVPGFAISVFLCLGGSFVYDDSLSPLAAILIAAPTIIGTIVATVTNISRAVSDYLLYPDKIIVGYNKGYIRNLEQELEREQESLRAFTANRTQQQPFREKFEKLSSIIVDELGGELTFEEDKKGGTRAFARLMGEGSWYNMNEGDYTKLVRAIIDVRERRLPSFFGLLRMLIFSYSTKATEGESPPTEVVA